MRIKTLLIDDEPRSRENLGTLLNDYCLEVEVIGEASNGKEAIQLIKKLQPDFIFLDIQMPEVNGLELANSISVFHSIPIVFVTAFEQYAIKAIKAKAFDYLLKPVKISELQECVNRVRQNLKEALSTKKIPSYETDKISLPWQNGFKIVDTKKIVSIEADNSYCKILFSDDDCLLFSKGIGDLEKLLNNSHFYRIHNTYLINLHFLDAFSNKDGGLVLMKNGKEYPVSRRRLTDFKQVSKANF
jgi:two-component system LytT family response regulator